MHFLNSVSYVEITGTRYKQGNILVCSFDEEIPVFGKIVDIIITKFSDCLFILIPYIGINFHTHYNAGMNGKFSTVHFLPLCFMLTLHTT